MSKNITIQEGGVAKQMTVDKLKTNLVSSGTCLWVPEDEVQLTTKTITENGTYNASDDGYYGYSQVIVSGVGSATGTDGDGDEAVVTTDPGTGELVTTKIPSSIRVDTPPSKTTYTDGETIDYSGMVVKAYLQTGGLWTDSSHPNGIIPISELILPATTASKASLEKVDDSAYSSLDISPLPNPISYASGGGVVQYEYPISQGGRGVQTYTITTISGKDVRFISFHRSDADGQVRSFWASDTSGELALVKDLYVAYDKNGNITYEKERNQFVQSDHQITIDGKTAYYVSGANTIIGAYPDAVFFPFYLWPNNTGDAGNTAWTMMYGQRTAGGYKVPVQWTRPGDFATLETYFLITIN